MKLVLLFLAASSFSTLSWSASQIHLTDAVTGAQSWEIKQQGVVLYLNQLLPDQLRGFYSNRGFTQSQMDQYVQSCVFMTVLRNESASGIVKYKTADWRVKNATKSRAIKSTDEWIAQHKALGVNHAALIAFRWAQFPTEQEYEPGGDWNQGMLSLGNNGDDFDLIAHWLVGNQAHQMSLKGINCAH